MKSIFPWWAIDDDSDEFERTVRAALRGYRKSLRQGPGSKLATRTRDKFARRKSREQLRKALASKRRPLSKATLLAKCIKSAVLDKLHPTRVTDWKPIGSRRRRKIIPTIDMKGFSFHENPNKVLEYFKTISMMCSNELDITINFSDQYINDIGAFLVFSEIWPAIRRFGRGGKMFPAVQKVLTEMGVGNEMGIRFYGPQINRSSEIWAMPIQRRKPLVQRRSDAAFLLPQKIEHAIDHFRDLIDSWLNIKDMELTSQGNSNLGRIFGELLDNAERHSIAGSRDGDWTMAAFMARRDGKYVCQIAVQSIGQSIADSFRGAHPAIRATAEDYANAHARTGQSKGTLKTLLALQDMVTTDPTALGEGGTGLMKVLQFFDELADDQDVVVDPRLTIISGESCIQLRQPYIRGVRRASENGRLQPALLWCNEPNQRSEPPEMTHVFDLTESFAGTLVTLAFEFDLDYLSSTLEKDHESDGD